jgi:hypothetical protein
MDTKFLREALQNWHDRKQNSRTWDQLSTTEQSEIMRDAQAIKKSDLFCSCEPLSIDEVLDGSRRSR